jgi:hypothetical protein
VSRLARILLAFTVAFVVTARTEAAAEHCRRLAAAVEISTPAPTSEAAPCHGANDAAPARPAHQPDQPSLESCECMAVLTGYVSIFASASSSHIEPYAWARPVSIAFASVEPSPALRPPRT